MKLKTDYPTTEREAMIRQFGVVGPFLDVDVIFSMDPFWGDNKIYMFKADINDIGRYKDMNYVIPEKVPIGYELSRNYIGRNKNCSPLYLFDWITIKY